MTAGRRAQPPPATISHRRRREKIEREERVWEWRERNLCLKWTKRVSHPIYMPTRTGSVLLTRPRVRTEPPPSPTQQAQRAAFSPWGPNCFILYSARPLPTACTPIFCIRSFFPFILFCLFFHAFLFLTTFYFTASYMCLVHLFAFLF